MIPEIKKILYATDLSASANHSFGYALSLAIQHKAKISIINVYEEPAHTVNLQVRSPIDFGSAKEKLASVIRAQLEQYLKKEDHDECQYAKYVDNIYVSSGAPVPSILDRAREGNYDLIVMGTHGHGFLYSALIGSTAQKMVHESPIPVLVVRLEGKRK